MAASRGDPERHECCWARHAQHGLAGRRVYVGGREFAPPATRAARTASTRDRGDPDPPRQTNEIARAARIALPDELYDLRCALAAVEFGERSYTPGA